MIFAFSKTVRVYDGARSSKEKEEQKRKSAFLSHKKTPPSMRMVHDTMRVFLRKVLASSSSCVVVVAFTLCVASVAEGVTFERSEVSAEMPVSTSLSILKPNDFTSEKMYPLVVYLHGFCLGDDAQQQYSFTASRDSPGEGGQRRQTLTQIGVRERITSDQFVYLPLDAPHLTRRCALCNIASDRNNYLSDRLTSNWINSTMSRIGPEFQCAAWAGSDACCNLEQAAKMNENNDAEYIVAAIEKVKATYPNIDANRVYVFGIATGGFMASRLACEKPDYFAGIASFAGATFADESKCKPAKGTTNFLGVHGTGDTVVPIEGGENIEGTKFPSFRESMSILSSAYGCKSESLDEDSFTLPTEATQRRAPKNVNVDVTTYEECRGDATLESWTIDGTDHFLEEKTSLALFSRVVKWLLEQRRLGESFAEPSSSSKNAESQEDDAVEKQSKSEDATISRIEFGAVQT